MSVGVNYLREHMPDHVRVHYAYLAYLDAGGPAPTWSRPTPSCAT